MPREIDTRLPSKRLRIEIRGVVQGVGFRPFVYAAAKIFGLDGFVFNRSNGVVVEAEGEAESLNDFQAFLRANAPPLAHIASLNAEDLEPQHSSGFYITESEAETGTSTFVSPDISVCDDCRRELFDKKDRRFHYPFINCTNCGSRFTITKDLPYGYLKSYRMLRGYEDTRPSSRRFSYAIREGYDLRRIWKQR